MATLLEALQIAVTHHRAARWAEAEAIYRRILAVAPDFADPWHLLGLVAKNTGRVPLARALICHALALQPDMVAIHRNLAQLLRAQGEDVAAVTVLRQALVLAPQDVETLFDLAVALHTLKRQEEAIPYYHRALELRPQHVDALYNLGVAYQNIGALDAAIVSYQQVIALDPAHAVSWNNLSATLRHVPQLDAADAAARRALLVQPDYGEASKNLAFSLLLRGDFAEGFVRYEGRRRATDGHIPALSVPEWDGAPLHGQRILLLAEQGLGDTIQFIRYAALVKERGAGAVVFACPPPLAKLLTGVAGVDYLVPHGMPLPPIDLQVPLMSLPQRLGTQLKTVPAAVPYLHPDPERQAFWRGRLDAAVRATSIPPLLRLGLVWAGNPGHRGDRLRSQRLGNFRSVLAVPGVQVFAVQLGVGRQDLADFAAPANFVDLGPDIHDFADTAAILAQLDLVISVDTSVAHLAGALGRPVWIILPWVPDWRWMMVRNDSPWYPTARLFRPSHPTDSEGVFRQLETALREMRAL